MNIAVIGYGIEGQSCHKYFSSRGDSVTICDKSTEIDLPNGVKSQLGEGYLSDLDRFDLIVRSAGINRQIILNKNPSVASKITTAINEFIANCPTKNIIGVTGTKGKGTTCTLITKMLEASGLTVWLGGNIGNSPLGFIDKIQPDDWVVLELSSFQLSDLRHSPHIAVCLMVVPEHLDWHKDLGDYTRAKSNLFKYQNKNDVAIYYADNATSSQIAHNSRGKLITYMAKPGALVRENGDIEIKSQFICNVSDLRLLGQHNWQNVCAAITAVWQTDLHNITAINSVLKSFTGLPHRIEYLESYNGIKIYNDSYATSLGATLAAIRAVPDPVVCLVGGYDRGLDFTDFVEGVVHEIENSKLKHIIVYGASSQRLSNDLRDAGVNNITISYQNNIDKILREAIELSTLNDSIVLSPGFASFDMFKNFEDRGNKFKQAVRKLK